MSDAPGTPPPRPTGASAPPHKPRGPIQTEGHWARYNAGHTTRDVRETCRQAMALAGPGAGRVAIDLGCGAGRETRALLEDGWQVVAYDSEPTMLAAADRTHPALTAHELSFEQIPDLPPADLIHASYALPFQSRESFDRLWTLIRASLRHGGLIAVNIFGINDAWSGAPNMTFLTAEEAEALATDLTIEHWHEQDEVGPAFSGSKHWHVFSIIARRPATP